MTGMTAGKSTTIAAPSTASPTPAPPHHHRRPIEAGSPAAAIISLRVGRDVLGLSAARK